MKIKLEKRLEVGPALAKKVLRVVDKGLSAGLGSRKPGRMCVEAAVAFASGEYHHDSPRCVDEYLSGLKINLNDRSWSSNKARAKGLRRLAIAQLGSKGHFTREVWKTFFSDSVYQYVKDNAPTSVDPDIQIEYWAKFNNGWYSPQNAISIGIAVQVMKFVHPAWGADQLLGELAEIMVQVLIKMKIKGTKYLYLTKPKPRKVKKQMRRRRRR